MMCNWNLVGRACAKWLLLTLNGLCIVTAVCTSGFAVVDMRVQHQYGEEYAAGTVAGDVIIIFTCSLLAVVAIFGCVGAAKANIKLLYLYTGFLVVLMLLELLVAVYVAVQRYGMEIRVTEWIRNDFFRNLTDGDLEKHQNLWDDLQTTYECCGLNGPEDYHVVRKPISISCCPRAFRVKTPYAQRQLYHSCLESQNYFSDGCEDEILYSLRTDADTLLGVAFVSYWLEGAEMLLAMWLANSMKYDSSVNKLTARY